MGKALIPYLLSFVLSYPRIRCCRGCYKTGVTATKCFRQLDIEFSSTVVILCVSVRLLVSGAFAFVAPTDERTTLSGGATIGRRGSCVYGGGIMAANVSVRMDNQSVS